MASARSGQQLGGAVGGATDGTIDWLAEGGAGTAGLAGNDGLGVIGGVGDGGSDGDGEGEAGGLVGLTGSVGFTGGVRTGADSVGRTARFVFRTGRRALGSRLGSTARSCSATPAGTGGSAGIASGGGGGTTTGPAEGGAMNGVVPLATDSPTFAEPVPMAAMIGNEDIVTSMTTITAYRLVGPERPAARCTPAPLRPTACEAPGFRWRTSGGTGLSPDCGTTPAPLRQGPHTGCRRETHSATIGERVNVPTFVVIRSIHP